MTRGDKIRQMTDEELASFLNRIKWDGWMRLIKVYGCRSDKPVFPHGIEAWKKWVKSEEEAKEI